MNELKLEKIKAKPRTLSDRVRTGTIESRLAAAAVLDVLGGGRSAPQAAETLGISLPRYYALEARAIEGLMKACEPRPRGRVVSVEKQIAVIKRELAKVSRDRDRLLTLVRVAHRTVALAEPKVTKSKRKRRAPVRAQRAAAVLRSAPTSVPETPNVMESSVP